ncbi:MAG: helix-turn-helix domain-containing protein [bacterium]|nr:helix-turn-helix domain-containing protein [bacterium]
MFVTRPASPPLRPFLTNVWYSKGRRSVSAERVLPTGDAHVVFSLGPDGIRLLDGDGQGDDQGNGHPSAATAVLAGPRATYYDKLTGGDTWTVGAMLRPAALRALAGVPAGEVAQRHTPLANLWGEAMTRRSEQALAEARTANEALLILESLLAARLPPHPALHPAVAHALVRFESTNSIATVARETGYSHRRFLALFRDDVGLPPKLFCRVARFQRTLELARSDRIALADVALESGFSDQPHLNRDFREFTGLTPSTYLRLATPRAHHVPLSNSFS